METLQWRQNFLFAVIRFLLVALIAVVVVFVFVVVVVVAAVVVVVDDYFSNFVNVIELNNSGLFLLNLLQIFSKFCSKL